MQEINLYELTYVGDYLVDDVEAFSVGIWDDHRFLEKIVKVENGENVFHWPIVFLGGIWYAYRGMMKKAIKVDAIEWVILFLTSFLGLSSIFWTITITLAYRIFLGYKGVPVYWDYVQECLDKRGLKGRTPERCAELTASLEEEGNCSKKRAVFYLIMRVLTLACISDVLTTLTWSLPGIIKSIKRLISFLSWRL